MLNKIRNGAGSSPGAGAILGTGYGSGAGTPSGNCNRTGMSIYGGDFELDTDNLYAGGGDFHTVCDFSGLLDNTTVATIRAGDCDYDGTGY